MDAAGVTSEQRFRQARSFVILAMQTVGAFPASDQLMSF